MTPFYDWKFCIFSTLIMLILVITQGNGSALVWGIPMYAMALFNFERERE